jgi:hypothetical protein
MWIGNDEQGAALQGRRQPQRAVFTVALAAANALRLRDAGRIGSRQECLDYIQEFWVDLPPLSLRPRTLGRRIRWKVTVGLNADAAPGSKNFRSPLEGMGPFTYLRLGQAVTLLGNSVLRFAFVVRAWGDGYHVTTVTLLSVCAVLPQVLLSPYAGSLVDRISRRVALQLADLGGGAVVCALSGLYFSGHISLWEIYASVVMISAAAAFQYPALSSTVPVLVSQTRLQRANGLLSTAQSVATISGPALAAPLLLAFGLGWILVVDLFTLPGP